LQAGISEVDLTTFLNAVMTAAGACIQPGPPVISCFMNADKRYAFVEFRCVSVCVCLSVCMCVSVCVLCAYVF